MQYGGIEYGGLPVRVHQAALSVLHHKVAHQLHFSRLLLHNRVLSVAEVLRLSPTMPA